MEAIAHTKNDSDQYHLLGEHLLQVAQMASIFAEPLGASPLAHAVGLLHDIGKYHHAFQEYLLGVEQNPALKGHGPEHKGAGAVFLADTGMPDLALLIQGHHGGLPSRGMFLPWLRDRQQDPAVRDSIAVARQMLPELQAFSRPSAPAFLQTRLAAEFFLRMLFSALIDADFLDTEAHFRSARARLRSSTWTIASLLARFEASYQERFAEAPPTRVNRVRAQVYQDCLHIAKGPPGFYRLTVPTGGGKTLSSLAFGLHHAHHHNKRRLIYAIPYMSITEQTAQEFRRMFPDGVLEHHSGIIPPEHPETLTKHDLWQRLAAENWDAPLIVTTTVQLFESLMARTPAGCRKLHNIAQSVIVLDEVQMLPTDVLDPILDVLRQLVADYGVTVVLCTATQPALQTRDGFEGLPGIQEIVSNAQEHFNTLKRVRYHFLPQPLTWSEVATALSEKAQVLAIVNTRANALALVEAVSRLLPDRSCLFHLSTRLCGAHRRAVLQQVQDRLNRELPCVLISTQLIEAGVNIDFPDVWRALGPFDRIAQAGGRANREGRRDIGHVVIFDPVDGRVPPGPYHIGTKIARDLLEAGGDLHDPRLFERYFEELYDYVDRDTFRIQAARRAWDYETVASRFRMITEQTTPVLVPYQDPEEPGKVARLLDVLLQDPSRLADLLRLLQPYFVNVSNRDLERAAEREMPNSQQKLADEVLPGLWVWRAYDAVRGLQLDVPAAQDDFLA